MKSIGIDIGTSQVKVVEIEFNSRGYQVQQAFIHNLTLSKTGTDRDLEVIEFLRNLYAQHDPQNTRFCLALRQDQVSVRNKSFPFNDRLRIQKTLPFELEEDLPFSSDNAIFDGKVIAHRGPTAEVLATATLKTHIAQLLDLCKSSGIAPHLISSEGTALANLFEKWSDPIPALPPPALEIEGLQPPQRHMSMVLHIGHTNTLVCAFEDQRLIGVRSILWGAKNIILEIAKKYNLSPLDAQRELEHKGFILTTRQEASFEAKIFSDLIAQCVRDLVRDLQLSMLEFKSEFNGEVIEVKLTGGLAGLQGLGPYLTQHLEVPVNPIQVLDLDSHVLIEKTPQAQLRLGVALGLALEGLRKPRSPSLNFMKGEFAKQSSFLSDLWTENRSLVLTLLVATALVYVWSLTRGVVATTLEDISRLSLRQQAKAVAQLPNQSANEAGVKKYIKESRKKIEEIRTLESLAGMNSAMDIVAKLSSTLPGQSLMKIDLRALSLQDENLRIAGLVSGGRESTEAIKKSLLALAVDGQVQTESIEPQMGKTAFRFSLKVDRNLQKEIK